MLSILSMRVLRTFTKRIPLQWKLNVVKCGEYSQPLQGISTTSRVLQSPFNQMFVPTMINRHKSTSNKNSKHIEDDEDDDDEDDDEEEEEDGEDDSDDEESYFNKTFPEDRNSDLQNNFKEKRTHISSRRMDLVLSSGLDIPRKKTEELFLESKIRHNGNRVTKKSVQMADGDYVDIVDKNEETLKVTKRVRLIKTIKQSEKYIVYLRCWK